MRLTRTLLNPFLQFLLIFHKAAAGELQEDSGLMALAKLSEIDVAQEGVKGAKDFFEAKVGDSFLYRTILSPFTLPDMGFPAVTTSSTRSEQSEQQ